ncbi:MAG: helix-turn-helix domain-containing protein [Deltaproteobacteria bacterium]|nr:helix-turn-helix domain-containing protein [Deltaproteobacteria bacterium]
MTVEQLAETLNVPKSWVYARTMETGPNAIPRLKLGKYVRFRPADVMDWLERQNRDRN